MDKRWKILEVETGKAAVLQESLKINAALCGILVQRGFDSFDKAKQYFRPQLSTLHNPWLMKDMDKAVAHILKAFEKKEKILVFGSPVHLLCAGLVKLSERLIILVRR